MRKAFTLVEMLIVVAILAVLMSIVFKLGLGGSDTKRATTIVRMQKIENCLSGYYAAFGSYPPVKVYGSRNIYCAVKEDGDQDPSAGENHELNWSQIKAACRSQPFGCEYPGDEEENREIENWSQELQERAGDPIGYPYYASSEYAPIFLSHIQYTEADMFNRKSWDNPDWKVTKIFKFGVMSFLLPRFLFMMGNEEFFDGSHDDCAQWSDNNDLPCAATTGERYTDWSDVWDDAQYKAKSDGGSVKMEELVKVANIPSQAVCARWMPNLEKICYTFTTKTFFGITITDSLALQLPEEYPPAPGTHVPSYGGSVNYKNATITVVDGWGEEFYYYSQPPYQSYILWSAGPNMMTFPPWMDRSNLNEKKLRAKIYGTWGEYTVAELPADDIMQMSH